MWPRGIVHQVTRGVPLDQAVEITEGRDGFRTLRGAYWLALERFGFVWDTMWVEAVVGRGTPLPGKARALGRRV